MFSLFIYLFIFKSVGVRVCTIYILIESFHRKYCILHLFQVIIVLWDILLCTRFLGGALSIQLTINHGIVSAGAVCGSKLLTSCTTEMSGFSCNLPLWLVPPWHLLVCRPLSIQVRLICPVLMPHPSTRPQGRLLLLCTMLGGRFTPNLL